MVLRREMSNGKGEGKREQTRNAVAAKEESKRGVGRTKEKTVGLRQHAPHAFFSVLGNASDVGSDLNIRR